MINRIQLTQYKHLGYRKAIGLVRAGENVFRLRPNGEIRLVTSINEVSRKRLLGVLK